MKAHTAEEFNALVEALYGLIKECDYSSSSGLPFNFPDGKGQWTQLANAKSVLRKITYEMDQSNQG
jgi:hypothetical protein